MTEEDVPKMLEEAFGIIANAMNVSTFTTDGGLERFEPVPGWHEAAQRWRDERYHPWLERHVAQESAAHDTFKSVDVNEFTSTTTYGVFNDPQVWEPRFAVAGGPIPDVMREVILDTPLFEDEDEERIIRHARLTNEDRERNGNLERDGMVLIRHQVTLRSPWILDVAEGGDVDPSERSPVSPGWEPPPS